MFKAVTGDVFSAEVDVLVHGCNAFHAMHSGVAGIVRREYMGAINEDYATAKSDENKMGTYSFWTGPHARLPGRTITICNAYTQFDYGRNKVHADYNAIKWVMQKIAEDFKDKVIGFPAIGCGLAGGLMSTVLDIFLEVFKKSSVDATLYLLPNEFQEVERKTY